MKRIVILLSAFFLCAGMVYVTLSQSLQAAWQEEREAAARNLRVERSLVEQELNQVLEKQRHVVLGKGCWALIIEELRPELTEYVVPILAEYGYTGVLALSETQLPDNERCISREEFDLLTAHQWSTCLYWDGEGTLTGYARRMKARLRELGLTMPKTLYMAYGKYTPELDEDIREAGFTTVIHHAESMEVITREDEEELFHLGCVAWNVPGIRATLDKAGQFGGSVALYLDFSTTYGGFTEERFGNMCGHLNDMKETMYQGDIAALRENLAMVSNEDYYSARRAYLEEELERYDREIAAVYKLTPKDFAV